jgi:hypothetical protein
MKVRFRRRARLKPVHDLFDLLLRLVKTAHGYLLLANKKARRAENLDPPRGFLNCRPAYLPV